MFEQGILIGVFLTGAIYFLVRLLILTYELIRRRYVIRNLPGSIRVSELKTLCKVHEWENIFLALSNLPIGKSLVCKRCGKVSGQEEYQLNQAAVDQLNQSLEIKKRKEAEFAYLEERFKSIVDRKVAVYVNQNLPNFKQAASAETDELIGKLMLDLSRYTIKVAQEATSEITTEKEGS